MEKMPMDKWKIQKIINETLSNILRTAGIPRRESRI